ncbi:hypothetical protein MUO32_23905 [Shinella sp. CPCC 101442]|uniref:hypothetical protein n=1 Tax=Shinella sp. CPCC 101442 TaxID=2932265 RepID=UPI0021520C6A|nr:hypothetical protein [Shinella sp. CPCC 101442]MCR6502077.1 hypothetical protein [Shinella sp. CPCC 101442]
MPRIIAQDYTFVTYNARDFRKLCGREQLHAGLVIIVPFVTPALQRELFDLVLRELMEGEEFLNEVIKISVDGEEAVVSRYSLPVG